MSDVRLVLDSNVLVSAALFKNSIGRRAFNKAIMNGQVLMSEAVLAELQDVLDRPRFDRYLSLELRRTFLSDLLALVEIIETFRRIEVCRDPKDDKFLELAVSGGAAFIISSDKDLLVLNPFEGIEILSPLDFLAER